MSISPREPLPDSKAAMLYEAAMPSIFPMLLKGNMKLGTVPDILRTVEPGYSYLENQIKRQFDAKVQQDDPQVDFDRLTFQGDEVMLQNNHLKFGQTFRLNPKQTVQYFKALMQIERLRQSRIVLFVQILLKMLRHSPSQPARSYRSQTYELSLIIDERKSIHERVNELLDASKLKCQIRILNETIQDYVKVIESQQHQKLQLKAQLDFARQEISLIQSKLKTSIETIKLHQSRNKFADDKDSFIQELIVKLKVLEEIKEAQDSHIIAMAERERMKKQIHQAELERERIKIHREIEQMVEDQFNKQKLTDLAQLNQDILRLQDEKQELLEEIQNLRRQGEGTNNFTLPQGRTRQEFLSLIDGAEEENFRDSIYIERREP